MKKPRVINIDLLSEAELIDLNHRIVERLNMIKHLRAHANMLEFSVGERVFFHADVGHVEGILTRYNRKTVTVVTDDGRRWNVSPHFLKHVTSPQNTKQSPRRLS